MERNSEGIWALKVRRNCLLGAQFLVFGPVSYSTNAAVVCKKKHMKKAFEHQDYRLVPQPSSYELIEPQKATYSSEFASVLKSVGASLRKRAISRVFLVHGTMVGTDALGWYSYWQRITPTLAKNLKSTYKSIVERISGDQGNFTAEYEHMLRNSINSQQLNVKTADKHEIAVERFEWTSENHHLGRANAAVALALRLIKLAQSGERRILLLGHSHAGNVFALVSQLLGQIGNPNSAATL